MAHRPPETPSDAAEHAQHFVEEIEYGSRQLRGIPAILIPALAAGWALFQLSLPYLVVLNSDIIRAVHLAFAISLVYLSFPALKKRNAPRFLAFLSQKRGIPVIDLGLAAVAAFAALYYALDYEGIAGRIGLPLARDYVVGILLIVLLLEAARRALGPALPIIATLFILYGFVSPYMPDLIAARPISVRRLIGQLTMSTEGIYGIPLHVSATTVFLFVLFGAMLDKTGGGEYLVRLAFSLLGTFRGGPAKAAVLGSAFTGMVSGSSIANVVTTGTFTIPLMRRAGYPAEKAAAIEVAASTNGQLMPPIMGAAAFIIAEYCNMTYFEVIRAAFVPACIAYIALVYITHLEACKLGLEGVPRIELPPFWSTLASGFQYLIPLGLLLYLLIVRQYSPEFSAFWAIVMLVITYGAHRVVFREGQAMAAAARDAGVTLWQGLVNGGRGMMSIGVAVAAAGIIVGVVGMGPGQRITEVVAYLAGDNIVLILLLTAFASLILGMGLPTTANYIVMASLTAQVIITLAGDAGIVVPLIAAHLFCFYFGILADDTPPVGLAAYAASAIARSDPIRTGVQGFLYDMRTAILPFMFFFNTDLLLWGLTAWWQIAGVFIMGTVGMLAFASVTQRYFLVRNRIYESVLLGSVTLFLLRPRILDDLVHVTWVRDLLLRLPHGDALIAWAWGHPSVGYVIGSVLFVLVWLLQWRRRSADRATAGS
jgi:TRAP transporter 4TM/12TM fusion protein